MSSFFFTQTFTTNGSETEIKHKEPCKKCSGKLSSCGIFEQSSFTKALALETVSVILNLLNKKQINQEFKIIIPD